MVKAGRLAVAPALVACLRDASAPTVHDIAHVAWTIAGDLHGWALSDQGLSEGRDPRDQAQSLIYARLALFGDEWR